MPSARPKMKASRGVVSDLHEIDHFSDVEKRQCSPHLCAICEGGGDLVICDGPCHRQFHRTHALQDSIGHCPGVFIPDAKSSEAWHCPDCTSQNAKCFQCGHLGTMHTDVRKCTKLYCVRWYCRRCLPLEKSTCPLHTCHSCELGYTSESLEDVVQCLRCPISWHKDCLQHIQRKDVDKTRWGEDRPAWQHTSHDHIHWMVYFPNHPIDPTLGTPKRNHISWL